MKREEDFKQFISQYEDLVFSICVRLLSNQDQAAQAAANIFLSAYPDFSQIPEFKKRPWITRAAVMQCMKYKK